MELWVCGKLLFCGGWELVGVFSTCEKAHAACKTDKYFVGPAELDGSFGDGFGWISSTYTPSEAKT